jgi:hypothetical protein
MLQTLHELGGGAFLREPIAPKPGQLKRAFFRAVRAVHPDKVRSSVLPMYCARPRVASAAPDLLAPLIRTPPRPHPHPHPAVAQQPASSDQARLLLAKSAFTTLAAAHEAYKAHSK